ncbi:MAG TPA: hypothetical protein VJ998_02685, partial [Pseudomonadales bacterium]|nr:hypothetical protein [Pseudomonadales bacterium]
MSEMSEQPTERQVSPVFTRNPPPIPEDPWNTPLEDINMIDGQYFERDVLWDFFKRLRRDDPVHLNELPETGRYWSVTKFNDIMYVDSHHDLFSSAHGIGIGPRIDAEPNPD